MEDQWTVPSIPKAKRSPSEVIILDQNGKKQGEEGPRFIL
jgi:hypothetical protein